MKTPRPHARRTLAPQPPPPGPYASRYAPELGAAICRRVAAGESLRAICADPAMPTAKTVWNWARAHPEFAAIKAHALATARARSLAEAARRDAARPPAPRGPAWNAGRDGYRLDPQRADAVLTRLAMGMTLEQACAAPGAPSAGTVYRWLRRSPEYLARYRKAKAMGQEQVVDTCCEDLVWEGRRRSFVTLGRTIRAAARRARRLALKRYAPARGPSEVVMVVRDGPDEEGRVVYD